MKKNDRIWELDALRGVCILCVIAVHLIYDLGFFIGLDLHLPAWYVFIQQYGGVIFVILSGCCATLGSRSFRRGCIVFACGLLISLVTFGMYRLGMASRDVIVWFGVLHLLGVCMMLYPVYRRLPTPALGAIGIVHVDEGYLVAGAVVRAKFLFPRGRLDRRQDRPEDRQHPDGKHARVHDRRNQRRRDAAECLLLFQRLCSESRAQAAQHGLADAHDDQPERAGRPQQIRELVRAGDARDQAHKAEHEAQSRARAGPEQDRAHDDRYQRQRDRDRPDPDAAGYGLQHDDQRGQNGQRGQTDDGCMIVAFHKYLLLSLRVFPDATQIFYHGQCPVITETKKLPGEGSAYGISSSTGSLEMGAPSLMACHCSRVMSSWRGLEPSNGPTRPRSSISSIMRAARA